MLVDYSPQIFLIRGLFKQVSRLRPLSLLCHSHGLTVVLSYHT